MNKLALGTVQFGLNYGASNFYGQTNLSEASKIRRWSPLAAVT